MITLFDILGPTMVGPSSSHTAGACRLGQMARALLGDTPEVADIELHGSFAATGEGHGTHRAVLGGLIGLHPADPRLRDSDTLARAAGLRWTLTEADLGPSAHPNSVRFRLRRGAEAVEAVGCSLGGGRIRLDRIDAFEVELHGTLPALVVEAEDVPGSIANIAGAFAEGGVNLATMRVSRARRGGLAVLAIEADDRVPDDVVDRIAAFEWVTRVRRIPALDASPPGGELFASLAEVVRQAEERGVGLAQVVADRVASGGVDPDQVRSRLDQALRTMREAVDDGIATARPSPSGLLGGRARTLDRVGPRLLGPSFTAALTRALATLEVNAAMGVIVAAPTAGAAGVLPAALFTLQDAMDTPRERLVDALLVAGGIGGVLAARASLSGASGGCQAETGSAAAMAAGALVDAQGGSPRQVSQAVALALQGMLGLICDPIAGLVEIPCAYRNASAAVQAFAAAEMALAGLEFPIPADEVIDVMGEVGRKMDHRYRETALGGLAATPTAATLVPMPRKARRG